MERGGGSLGFFFSFWWRVLVRFFLGFFLGSEFVVFCFRVGFFLV